MSAVREDDFPGTAGPGREEPVADLESALRSLFRVLKQSRLHALLLGRAQTDLDRAGVELLYALYAQDASLRLTDLAERLRIDAPAVTRKAQQLERAGLVGRTRDQADGRATRLGLTAPGRAAMDRILAARRVWLTEVLGGWSAADQAEFARLVRRFAGDVDRHLEAPHVCES